MNPTPLSTRPLRLCALLGGAVLLAGCGSGGSGPTAGSEAPPSAARKDAAETAEPHGYVEGAEEAQEPQSRLVLAESGTGAVRVLDLLTGKAAQAGEAPGVRDVLSDGRFGYVATASGTYVVDSGGWTVDHGDHVHYYRAAIRAVGRIGGAPAARVHSDAASVALTREDGSTGLFDRRALEDGAVGKERTMRRTATAVVPYEGHLVAAGAGEDGTSVEIRDRTGVEVDTLGESCGKPSGQAVTRAGVVLGCADGAVLVSEEEGEFRGEEIPYPRDVPAAERATAFTHRPGSSTLVALAGDGTGSGTGTGAGSRGDAVWQLDVEKRTWKRFATGPVVAANSAGAGTDLLALGPDGELTSYDAESGRRTASRKVLSEVPAGVRIEVDAARAYVNDPAAKQIHEIDYTDRLREARTFDLDFAPDHMAGAGR